MGCLAARRAAGVRARPVGRGRRGAGRGRGARCRRGHRSRPVRHPGRPGAAHATGAAVRGRHQSAQPPPARDGGGVRVVGRACARSHRGRLRGWRQPAIAWNPNVAWTEAMSAEMRAHLAYMLVDMPAEERATIDPDAVLERYAIAGDRSSVVARLSDALRQVQPEMLLFDAHDYSV